MSNTAQLIKLQALLLAKVQYSASTTKKGRYLKISKSNLKTDLQIIAIAAGQKLDSKSAKALVQQLEDSNYIEFLTEKTIQFCKINQNGMEWSKSVLGYKKNVFE